MITSNILQRVLKVKNGNSCGTWFTIDIDQNQYLISAKHIFPNIVGKCTIEIMNQNMWTTLETTAIECSIGVDIIIFLLAQPITPKHSLLLWGDGRMNLSEDAYFLGFPFGYLETKSWNMNNGYAFPFIKKCCISGFDITSTPKTIWLDWHNNKWFSGWPVVICKENNQMCIVGIVSWYWPDDDPKKMENWINENSWLFYAHSINHVLDRINII
jgi:hypothetical protein